MRIGAKTIRRNTRRHYLLFAGPLAIAALWWTAASQQRRTSKDLGQEVAGGAKRAQPLGRARDRAPAFLPAPALSAAVAPATSWPGGSSVDAAIAALESSGAAPGAWIADLQTRLAAWKQKRPDVLRVAELEASSCHKDGCLVQVTFEGPAAYGEFSRGVGIDNPFVGFADRSALVGPEEEGSGRLRAAWIVVPSTGR